MDTWSLRQFLQASGLDPRHGLRALWPGRHMISLRSFAVRHILQTDFVNPNHNADNMPVATGPGAPTFLSDPTPVWEWTPMVDPSNQFDTPGVNLVGLSGWVVMPPAVAARQGISDKDVPFVHPFGGFDWEFFVAPDPQYDSLLASPNKDVPDAEYREAKQAALDLGLSVPGVLGVETDKDLVPPNYRAIPGDRVAVFGRWIVDTGHPDFHTEIHPPLLLACARSISQDVTHSTVVGRPYLVSQDFGDGGARQHLINQISQIPTGIPGIPGNLHIDAHPKILTPPFSGLPIMSYIVRPPSPRSNPGDVLQVSYHFTTRSGVAVQLINAIDEVKVIIEMNDVAYKPVSPQNRQDWQITLDDLNKLRPGLGTTIKDVLVIVAISGALLGDPIDSAMVYGIVSQGVRTDRYDAPQAVSVHDAEVTTLTVDKLGVGPHFSVDDGQPFPVYGFLDVQWERH